MKSLPFGYYIYKVRNLENHGTVNLLTLTLERLYFFIILRTRSVFSHQADSSLMHVHHTI